MKRTAEILAIIFHPIFVPVYVFLVLTEIDLVMNLVFRGELKQGFLWSMILTMVLGPMVSMYIMKRNGLISSMNMPDLKGRSLIYTVTAAYYLFSYYFIKDLGLPDLVPALFLSLLALLLVLAVISLRFKISAHTAGMAGAMAVLCWEFTFYHTWNTPLFLAVLFLTALIASARLYVNAHSITQVASGFVVGFATIWFGLTYLVH